MQISPADQAGIVTFALTFLIAAGALVGAGSGALPSLGYWLAALISAAMAGLLAYIHAAGISVSTPSAAATPASTRPPGNP